VKLPRLADVRSGLKRPFSHYIVTFQQLTINDSILAQRLHLLTRLAKAGNSRFARTKESIGSMKQFRILLALTVALANLVCLHSVLAADPTVPMPTPPTVVPQGRDDQNLQRDLRGVPDNLKTLILTFDQTRDRYLQQQALLLAKLHNATTANERDQIRQQLQANRQDFLAELKSFRDELGSDLQALKGKIGHDEFGRIIDAAHDATGGNGHRHRGQ
jgi:hypothetical protein